MAYRFYILPKVGTGAHGDFYRMKYIADPGGTGQIAGHATGLDYGVQPIFLVAANVTTPEHTAIAANADVLTAPLILNGTIGAGNLAAMQAGLESRDIPGEWVTAGMTWRAMLLWLSRLFQFAQRYNGLHGAAPFLDAQTNLDLRVNQVPAAASARYAATAQSFGFDPAQITGTMTIRQVLAAVLTVIPDGDLAGILRG